MIRTLSLATVLAAGLALSAMAKDAKTKIDPGAGPTSTMGDQVPQMKAAAAPTSAQQNAGISLTEQEGKVWINKPVYSSDGKNIGEVVDFQRDIDNKVIGMHAAIGGYWSLGQTRVNLTTSQFKLQGDRVLLDITAVQAKELPKVQS